MVQEEHFPEVAAAVVVETAVAVITAGAVVARAGIPAQVVLAVGVLTQEQPVREVLPAVVAVALLTIMGHVVAALLFTMRAMAGAQVFNLGKVQMVQVAVQVAVKVERVHHRAIQPVKKAVQAGAVVALVIRLAAAILFSPGKPVLEV